MVCAPLLVDIQLDSSSLRLPGGICISVLSEEHTKVAERPGEDQKACVPVFLDVDRIGSNLISLVAY